MLTKLLKIAGGLAVLALAAIAVFAVNLIWLRPWSLNLFYEKVLLGRGALPLDILEEQFLPWLESATGA